MSGSASASAAMQLRMSPTGGMPSSSRSAPDEPPSSATVTIAVRLPVCSLRPRRRVDRPVPPPIATIRGPRASCRFWRSTSASGVSSSARSGWVRLRAARHAPIDHERDADAADDQPAHRERQELERDQVDDRLGRAARLEVLRDLADELRAGEGQQEHAHEREDEPALDAHPGLEPAAKSQTAGRLTPARARDGAPRPARGPSRAAAGRAPRRPRSSGGGRRCSRCRWSGGSCPPPRRPGC